MYIYDTMIPLIGTRHDLSYSKHKYFNTIIKYITQT